MFLSAIETLICRREMSLRGSTSFAFAQNAIHDFKNTVLNLLGHCLRQMPQKRQNYRVVQIRNIFRQFQCDSSIVTCL